jgi:hypothetical protein
MRCGACIDRPGTIRIAASILSWQTFDDEVAQSASFWEPVTHNWNFFNSGSILGIVAIKEAPDLEPLTLFT